MKTRGLGQGNPRVGLNNARVGSRKPAGRVEKTRRVGLRKPAGRVEKTRGSGRKNPRVGSKKEKNKKQGQAVKLLASCRPKRTEKEHPRGSTRVPNKILTCIRVDTPMGTHFYIYDYQVKSTAFFNILSELHNSSSIHTLYLQGFIGTEAHSVRSIKQTNK